ncbi:MAG: hypothetical protein PHU66_09150 [Bacteroidaceae bacterium]|nr:hypothetical protein [Bacteroidaceae bacterium]
MTRDKNIEKLREALETIRTKQYPDVPMELLEALLLVEYNNLDNRTEAQSKSMKVLDDYLNKLADDSATG